MLVHGSLCHYMAFHVVPAEVSKKKEVPDFAPEVPGFGQVKVSGFALQVPGFDHFEVSGFVLFEVPGFVQKSARKRTSLL